MNMKHLNWSLVLIAVVLICLIGVASSAQAAPQATYTLIQSYIGSSGQGSDGIYAVSSSVGQATAGEVSAGSYTLGGGFWGGGLIVFATSSYRVYLPLLIK
jgi:hypothetical protein